MLYQYSTYKYHIAIQHIAYLTYIISNIYQYHSAHTNKIAYHADARMEYWQSSSYSAYLYVSITLYVLPKQCF